MARCSLGLLAAAQLLASCTGALTSPSGPAPDLLRQSNHEVSFACKDGALPVSSMQRLSRTQYENTVHDLLEAELPSQIDDLWREVASSFVGLPADTVSAAAPFASPFSTMDQAVSQQHVSAYFSVAQAVAQSLTASDARVTALLACHSGEADNDCVKRFIGTFARRAFRHEPLAEELAFLAEVYAADGIDVAGLRDVITVMLNTPQFLYRVEFGATAVASRPGTYTLSSAELATRLAYHFWQSMPDDALLDRAKSGALDSDASYAQVVEAVHNDPRTLKSLRVFVNEWLGLDNLPPLDGQLGTPVFDAFVGSDKPSSTLRDDMVNDVLDSFVFHASRADSLADWYESPYSFAKSDELAAIYGSEKWNGDDSEPPGFPAGQRAGLLTRAALLSTGTARTRPIMKGVLIRTRLLCDRVPPPPANATNIPAALTQTMSTRQVVEKLTEQPNSTCSSCHSGLLNPLGFATENYDALGRIRTQEVLYSAEGKQLASMPVLTKSVPHVWSDDSQPSMGAADLTKMVLESGKAESCFARQYIRFAYGRTDDDAVNGCALESVRAALKDGHGLREAIGAPVLRPEFRQRFVGDVQ